MPWMGLAESALLWNRPWGDCGNGSSAVGEAGREPGSSSWDGGGAMLPPEPGCVCAGLEGWEPQLEVYPRLS